MYTISVIHRLECMLLVYFTIWNVCHLGNSPFGMYAVSVFHHLKILADTRVNHTGVLAVSNYLG